jgi:hypothetical protein
VSWSSETGWKRSIGGFGGFKRLAGRSSDHEGRDSVCARSHGFKGLRGEEARDRTSVWARRGKGGRAEVEERRR